MSDLPIKLLEAVVPGYSLFTNVIQQWLGFDISLVMTCVAFFFIAKRAVSFVYVRIYATFMSHCTSSVHVDGGDDLYATILQWMSVTRPDLSRRSLTARTNYGNVQYDSGDEDDGEDADMLARVAVGEHGYYNFSKTAARIPPRYEPDYGQFWFSCRHGVFQFRKSETRLLGADGSERTEQALDLRCIGFNTDPIKALVADIKAWTVRKESSKTVIRIPASDRWNAWMRSSERPSRPLDTVILDPEQKALVLADMNEYLHPLSPKWYAARGIPYRRGYLFHGPPGTGKTSLSFSLAGIFGLDIHIVNLMDSSMSESMLSRLFNNLPKRCIVLFEDIDAAGVKKRESDSDDSGSESDNEEPAKKKTKKTKARHAAKEKRRGHDKTRNQITAGPKAPHTEATGGATEDDQDKPVDSAISSPPKPKTNGIHIEPVTTENEQPEPGRSNPDADPAHASDSDSDASSAASPTPNPQISIHDLARALIRASRPNPPPPTHSPAPRRNRNRRRHRHRSPSADSSSSSSGAKISLSGLLNVIDGVATHEGRILIMTTNHPEKLDPALIRAGRVDLQIAFTHASRLQIKNLFVRMYASADHHAAASEAGGEGVDADELEVLSNAFADALPEATFAPSDVQGYLLCFRKKPREAVDKVAAWRDGKIKEMKEKEEKAAAKKAKKT